jgi:hypothetical protein
MLYWNNPTHALIEQVPHALLESALDIRDGVGKKLVFSNVVIKSLVFSHGDWRLSVVRLSAARFVNNLFTFCFSLA